MSLGGNIAQWLFVIALFAGLDGSTTGHVALQCGAVAFALFGSITEVPIIIDAIARGDARAAWQAYLPTRKRTIRRAVAIGSAVTIGLFFLL